MGNISKYFYNEVPEGVSVEANIEEALKFKQKNGMIESLKWFKNKVQNGGEWDYKQLDKQDAKREGRDNKFEAFGNWNYGVVGTALGIPKPILLSLAGGAQNTNLTGGGMLGFTIYSAADMAYGLLAFLGGGYMFPSNGFGLLDDPRDTASIIMGIDAYKNNYNIKDDKLFSDLSTQFEMQPLFNNGFSFADFLKGNFNFSDYLDRYTSPFLSPTIYDPITLDLNKDGKINTTGLDKGVYFDHSSDKVAMKTSWVGKEDGLLVHDRNSNGIIDDGSELFGNFTPLNPNNNPSKRNLAVNGYHALKSYDMNSDGIIDDNDEIYKYLKVWQDINSDGISQADELKTLEQASIKSLNLAFENIDKDLDNGNNLMFEGNYTDNEGKEHKMADINFNVDTVSSKHKDDITLNQEQANQINLQGSGNLRDLNQAAVLSSTLNDILNNYKYANTKEEQLNLLPNLINEWAKTLTPSRNIC